MYPRRAAVIANEKGTAMIRLNCFFPVSQIGFGLSKTLVKMV